MEESIWAIEKLKKVSLRDLEEAIAKAVSELAEDHYDCSITQITFDELLPEPKAKLQLKLEWDSLFQIKEIRKNEDSKN